MSKVKIFDSTLRDGAQGEGVVFSVEDKLAVAQYLDRLGISYIEGGNPTSNPKDCEFFQRAKELDLKNAKIVSFTSTHKVGADPSKDAMLAAILEANAEYVSVFGKSWDMHVTDILGAMLEQNLGIITSTIRYLTDNGKSVFFDSEHFFDGYKANPQYAMETLKAARDAGAKALVLCDTNGSTFPFEVEEITKKVAEAFPNIEIGIHTHNDTGTAVASAIAAVRSGATLVQGTFGGFGERCGNMDLCTLIPNLQLKLGYECIPPENMELLTDTARAIAESANIGLDPRTPYVGASAFAHKGGMHSDAVIKKPASYEHIAPEVVGNERRVLMSEVAGRSAIMLALKSVDPTIDRNSESTKRILDRLKELEHSGYEFEGAEGSLEMLIKKELGRFTPHFNLGKFSVVVNEPSEGLSCNAMVKIFVDGEEEITAAEGEGPVNALDTALRRALGTFYPELKKMSLIDYKVRVLSSTDGTASKVRVLITSTNGKKTWRTVGVSADIIDASWKALVDSIEYFLTVVR
ncbi:MAG: 2-isopropylmalate synthase [Firmicutes bacterium ADurb.Bin193]|nr:MAG: 2-isopropylmalate synthase [Firmicutes bacterium ADurb.Bin193]